MMSKNSIVMVVAAALVVTAIAGASQDQSSTRSAAPKPAPAEVKKAVLARLAEIQSAAQTLDAEKVFRFVLENDKGALVQNGKLILTRKEALEATRQGFQRLRKVAYQFDQQHITLISPTVALATGEGSSSATTDDGRTLSTPFAQSVVLVLTNGEWMVLHAHRSFPPTQ
jgi:hypothetical protein